MRPDIIAYDNQQRPRLLAETRLQTRLKNDREQLQTLAEEISAPQSAMVMLVTLREIYLWTKVPEDTKTEPDYVRAAEPHLRPIAEEVGLDYAKFPAQFLTDIVAIWLERTGANLRKSIDLGDELKWIHDSGLATVLSQTYITVESRLEPVH